MTTWLRVLGRVSGTGTAHFLFVLTSWLLLLSIGMKGLLPSDPHTDLAAVL